MQTKPNIHLLQVLFDTVVKAALKNVTNTLQWRWVLQKEYVMIKHVHKMNNVTTKFINLLFQKNHNITQNGYFFILTSFITVKT